MNLKSSIRRGLSSVVSATAVTAEETKPARLRLMTGRGETVAPESAWKEYPRPQFVLERWVKFKNFAAPVK
jgi:hypothetical protein